ncbi:MAG: hypothetical protein KBG84_11715 [Planctomycetes bacterium]|nr:hypothetical protein [Planctomycetota bacterium]
MRWFAFLLLIPLALAGCGGEDNGGSKTGPKAVSATAILEQQGGTANADGGAPVMLTISGKVTFERYTATAFGLAATPVTQNAAFVLVEFVQHETLNTLVATSVNADANGDYTATFSTDRDFFVRARALLSAGSLACRVLHTQMNTPVVHAVSSGVTNRASGSQVVNLNADLALPHLRGGAFAALDTARALAEAAAYGGSPTLGPLDLYWAAGNLGTSFMRDLASLPVAINQTRFVNTGALGQPGIEISGGRWDNVANSDHDEFDSAVIAHEFVHFLMRTQSRDNNWGGAHNGEAFTPNAAYGEGLPTGLGNALLGVKDYVDTTGLPSGTTSAIFTFDCENPSFVAGVPSVVSGVTGYQSEFAVAAVAWDLIDGSAGGPASSDGDPVAITRAGFLASFYALRTRNGTFNIAYLATLLQQLIDDAQLSSGNANTLVGPHNAAFPPTGADNWPPVITAPGTVNAGLDASTGPGSTPANVEIGANANACYRLTLAAPQSVTFNLNATTGTYNANQHRVDFYIYDLANALVGGSTGAVASKSVTLNLPAGDFLIRVHHAAANAAPVTFTLTLP